MRELAPYANDFDRYIYGLLEMLRTKYFDVEVLRGHDKYLFKMKKRVRNNVFVRATGYIDSDVGVEKEIPYTTLKAYYILSATPLQIKELMK
jgi:radical SAM superfamily enzyme with C-terminal helix-hairpin-helix motif